MEQNYAADVFIENGRLIKLYWVIIGFIAIPEGPDAIKMNIYCIQTEGNRLDLEYVYRPITSSQNG